MQTAPEGAFSTRVALTCCEHATARMRRRRHWRVSRAHLAVGRAARDARDEDRPAPADACLGLFLFLGFDFVAAMTGGMSDAPRLTISSGGTALPITFARTPRRVSAPKSYQSGKVWSRA